MDRLRKLGNRWPWFGRVLDVHERVGEVNGGAVASSVTLTVFVSLFPLALATIAVIGFLAAGDADVPGKIVDNLSLTGAAADTVTDAIATAQESRRAASIIGFLGLLWSGLNVTTAVATAVRLPWQVKPVGMKGKANGLLWLLGGVVLGGAGVALGAVLGFMPDWAPKVLTSVAVILLGLVVETGFFLWTFWVLGDRRPGWRALVPGALLGAVGFEILKLTATLYLPGLIASSSSLYGPLGVVFAILAWLALFARLLVYATTLNAVRFEAEAGTVDLHIEAPRMDGDGTMPALADRGGAVVEPDPPDEDGSADPDADEAAAVQPHDPAAGGPTKRP